MNHYVGGSGGPDRGRHTRGRGGGGAVSVAVRDCCFVARYEQLSHSPAHSPAHVGTKRQQPFKGPLTDRYSEPYRKRQHHLVAAGQCRECGNPLGRAVTVCDTCANAFCAAEAERREADKAATWPFQCLASNNIWTRLPLRAGENVPHDRAHRDHQGCHLSTCPLPQWIL
jgi:hypothetical protein